MTLHAYTCIHVYIILYYVYATSYCERHDYAEKPHSHGKLEHDRSQDTGPYTLSSQSHSTQIKVYIL